MTRLLVLLAMAMALAIYFVLRDIRRSKRAQRERLLNRWEVGAVELSDGKHSVEMTAHWQGHAAE